MQGYCFRVQSNSLITIKSSDYFQSESCEETQKAVVVVVVVVVFVERAAATEISVSNEGSVDGETPLFHLLPPFSSYRRIPNKKSDCLGVAMKDKSQLIFHLSLCLLFR
jgi:hypothetical protein